MAPVNAKPSVQGPLFWIGRRLAWAMAVFVAKRLQFGQLVGPMIDHSCAPSWDHGVERSFSFWCERGEAVVQRLLLVVPELRELCSVTVSETRESSPFVLECGQSLEVQLPACVTVWQPVGCVGIKVLPPVRSEQSDPHGCSAAHPFQPVADLPFVAVG